MFNSPKKLVTGYIPLDVYPNTPENDYPTKKECAGYKYISMVQLCNIAEKNGFTRSLACNSFGGDAQRIPVIPERQVHRWIKTGHRRKKFVLFDAVEHYFKEIGLDWE